MELLERFRHYLFSQKGATSPLTVKNYLADVRKFISWYETHYISPFDPEKVTNFVIKEYKTHWSHGNLSFPAKRSVDRYLSSLRKFFNFLREERLMNHDPMQEEANHKTPEDTWHLKAYKQYLSFSTKSNLTIKNYINDVRQFLAWLTLVSGAQEAFEIEKQNVFGKITSHTLEEYKFRLFYDAKLSPVSVNRKLSSLRRFTHWAYSQELLHSLPSIQSSLDTLHKRDFAESAGLKNYQIPNRSASEVSSDQEDFATIQSKKPYSRFPPVRLLQKINTLMTLTLEELLVSPIASLIGKLQFLIWKLSGEHLFFEHAIKNRKTVEKYLSMLKDPVHLTSVKSSFYAPLSIAVASQPMHKKLIHHLRFSRPKWYRRYHMHIIVHYLHFAFLVSVISLLVIHGYNLFITPRSSVLSETTSIGARIVSFEGILHDPSNNPVTETTLVRFSLYNDQNASGEAMLWQDVLAISPDSNGHFKAELGTQTAIPGGIFRDNPALFLGISVATDEELKPRSPLSTIAYAMNADMIDGLIPITSPHAANKNVLLALDSAGNLTMNARSNTTFQAINGSFSLSGRGLILQTAPGSGSNIALLPDGFGIIDLQKPLQNTSITNNLDLIAGSVEINDTVAILATSSAQPAITILQDGQGPLIVASVSGVARFSIANDGDAMLGGNLSLNGSELRSTQPAFGLLNSNVKNITFADSASYIVIGAATGTATLRNATTEIRGNLHVGGKTGITLTQEGSGITFTNSGTHRIIASSGNLELGSQVTLVKGVSIIPGSAEGGNNLGSASLPFDTLYVKNIVSPNLSISQGLWQTQNNILLPINNSSDIIIGGNATNSGSFQIFALGNGTTPAGTASLSGNLVLRGTATQIAQLNGGSITFVTSPGGEENLTERMRLTSEGRLGIGTTTPDLRFVVSDTNNTLATALLKNASNDPLARVLSLQLGSVTPQVSNYYVSFLNNDGSVIGKIQGNGAGGISYATSGSDFAEYFKKADPREVFVPGDLVCITTGNGVTRCRDTTHDLLGVVSDKPGFTGGANHEADPNFVLVGLVGQIPVRVQDPESLKAGDMLSPSHIPGVAQKATEKGEIIGRVLERDTTTMTDKVLALIRVSWYDPSIYLTDRGYLNLVAKPPLSENSNSLSEALLAPYYYIYSLSGEVIKNIGVFSEAVIGTLKAGFIEAKDLTIEGSAYIGKMLTVSAIQASKISTLSLSVAGMTLEEYVERLLTNHAVFSPLAKHERIETNILTPLTDDAQIALSLKKDAIEVTNGSTTVARIDNAGNATFSGTLAAHNASLSGSFVADHGTFSGVLRAKKIIADEIDLPVSPNVTNNYETASSESAQNTSRSSEIAMPSAGTLADGKIDLSTVDLASLSGLLAYIPKLETNFATISNGLMVFGPASFSDIAVAGQFSVNGHLTITDTAINVLASALELQPLRLGNIALMGGLITIDTKGNLLAQGDVRFMKDLTTHGTIHTNILSPLALDIAIRLKDKEERVDSNFSIQNASGSSVLRVNQAGDVTSSGSGLFADLIAGRLQIVRTAQADTSLTETVATASAGTATITAYETERTIITPYITEKSLIYISPTSDTQGTTPYIARQIPEDPVKKTKGSFTIQIAQSVRKDITINWWIVN